MKENANVDLKEHNEKGNDSRSLITWDRKNTGLYSKLNGKPQKGFKLRSDMIQENRSDMKYELGMGST